MRAGRERQGFGKVRVERRDSSLAGMGGLWQPPNLGTIDVLDPIFSPHGADQCTVGYTAVPLTSTH